jgi:hypothetical protein
MLYRKLGGVVLLAEPRRGVAVLFENLADSGVLRTDYGVVAWESGGLLSHHAEADGVMVATGIYQLRCDRRQVVINTGRRRTRPVEILYRKVI